jgi:hypothetical protein
MGVVVTLDPNKFAEKKQQRFRIGDQQSFQPHVLPFNQFKVSRIFYDYNDHGKNAEALSYYPSGTNAFLYYSMLPEKPRICGELRLRVTSSDDPASFESGSDLLQSNGRPWSRPLYHLSKYYSPLYEKLREERFVPDDLDAALSTIPSRQPRYCSSQLLYTLNDTFTLDFSSTQSNLFAITEQGVERLTLNNLFVDVRRLGRSTPYTGAYTNHHLSILLN